MLARLRERVDDVARRSPARLTLIVFASVIAIVTALLSLPIATASGETAPFADALFTATSAVCVTGLVTVDTAVYWSTFGQAVILIGIQIGGLGVMTLASILGLAVSRRIGLTQKLLAAAETKTTRLGEVGSLVRVVLVTIAVLESALFVVLLPKYLLLEHSLGTAIWHALFQSVSIFNNAGFIIEVGGLGQFVGDWWMNLPIIIGGFVGALGFPAILSIAGSWRRPRHWSLHAKLTLATSTILYVVGVVAIGALEWANPRSFGALPVGDRILAALLAGGTPRSSGFSTVDIGTMSEATWLVQDALMFVGGGSASTAGGIKVTTFAVMVLAILAEARGDPDIEAFGRRVAPTMLRLAIAVAFVGATLVGAGTLSLLILTDLHLDVILFEVISAFATCGLSTGITPHLPDSAKYVLAALMFTGRIGTMTLAAALALRDRRRVIRLPEERPTIG
ncbi:TrkH family potassium uptake protein [Ruania halotolerans]|uniref:TrkH family potassium uptake protein n=1 Tax=Ruania halotolerans TaxID=2897773 RepID=UPI001E51AE62|nr:potassium transporter TrkG [Ruania halotolerans]UFU08442.1 TrkH family potassium uptake protein [Ruania halotolerans]